MSSAARSRRHMTPRDLESLPFWHERRCDGIDPETFFQSEDEHWTAAHKRLVVAAHHYCAPCPIRDACRAAGENAGWGMWGGLTHRKQGSKTVAIDLLAPKGA